MNDTAMVATTYCPTCEPHRDPVAEILAVHYCGYHYLSLAGSDDSAARVSTEHLFGGMDAGGAGNREFCALVHRGRK